VGQILWSEAATAVMKRLDPVLRGAIEQRTGYLRRTPRMYARGDDERFPGCRGFWIEDLCHVYYMVVAEGDDCYIMAIEEMEQEETGLAGDAYDEQEA